MRRVRAAIVAVEKQWVLHNLSACLCSHRYPACNAHAPHCQLWHESKCTLVQALRLCTGRTAHTGSRGITLLFNDHGTRRGWGVSVTPRPLFTPGKDPVPIVQKAGWARGPIWTGAENLAPTGIRSPGRSVRSQSLYQLRYPVHSVAWPAIQQFTTLSHKRHDFRRKGLFNIKCVSSFAATFVRNIFHSKKNWTRYKKYILAFKQSALNSCPILINLNFSTEFRQKLKHQSPWKSFQWQPICSMRTDERTDMMKLIVVSRRFASAPKYSVVAMCVTFKPWNKTENLLQRNHLSGRNFKF